LSVNNVTDCVNMWNISLFLIIYFEFTILFTCNSSCKKIDTFSHSISTDSKQYSIIFSSHFFISFFVGHCNLAIWTIKFFQFAWSSTSDKLSFMIFHICSNSVSHILIKSSKEYRSNHDSSVISESCQKSCTLQSNI